MFEIDTVRQYFLNWKCAIANLRNIRKQSSPTFWYRSRPSMSCFILVTSVPLLSRAPLQGRQHTTARRIHAAATIEDGSGSHSQYESEMRLTNNDWCEFQREMRGNQPWCCTLRRVFQRKMRHSTSRGRSSHIHLTFFSRRIFGWDCANEKNFGSKTSVVQELRACFS